VSVALSPVPATVELPPVVPEFSLLFPTPPAPTTTVNEPEVVTAKEFFLQYPPAPALRFEYRVPQAPPPAPTT
jgi:hypothetical protein